MVESLFDLPLIIAGPVIIASLCTFAIVGLVSVRRFLLPRLRIQVADSEFSGALVQCVMVFYGLAAGLIAVSVFQTYSEATTDISYEASSIASLYRDISVYPEPIRADLQERVREYTRHVIDEAWPLQRQGKIPAASVERMNEFQAVLASFEPATDGQKLVHAETLGSYNRMIQARRLRLDIVGTRLPGVMWMVILLGAIISMASTFFFNVEDVRLHAILVTLLAIFIGLVILMMFALDRPFRGDLGLNPEPYQLVYDQLMNP